MFASTLSYRTANTNVGAHQRCRNKCQPAQRRLRLTLAAKNDPDAPPQPHTSSAAQLRYGTAVHQGPRGQMEDFVSVQEASHGFLYAGPLCCMP
jgi:hypothetical protein